MVKTRLQVGAGRGIMAVWLGSGWVLDQRRSLACRCAGRQALLGAGRTLPHPIISPPS